MWDLIRESLLRYSINNGVAVPHYMDERDHPWLGRIIEEYLRFVGRTRSELCERWKEPLPFYSPPGKRALAIHVLGRLGRDELKSSVSPQEIREIVFQEAARSIYFPLNKREAILEQAGQNLNISAAEIEQSLFADLPDERKILPLEKDMSAQKLALECNLLLAQGILFRATQVEIKAFGHSRPVIRQAKLRRLICTIRGKTKEDLTLLISGPLSLFRRTLVYGRHLAEVIPLLAWTNQFELRAECVLRGKSLTFRLQSGEPIAPGRMPKVFDSQLEQRFSRDFQRLNLDWDLIREPEPVEAGDTMIFPDFYIQNRKNPKQGWFVEIIGFWTPEYLSQKLERLRKANIQNIVLCIDETLSCANNEFPIQARIIRYKHRINPNAVLAAIL